MYASIRYSVQTNEYLLLTDVPSVVPKNNKVYTLHRSDSLVSGQEFLALGWFFSRVSPIPFLGLVWLFWVWCHPSHFWVRFGFLGVVSWLFWPFSPCVYSVPGLPGLF